LRALRRECDTDPRVCYRANLGAGAVGATCYWDDILTRQGTRHGVVVVS